MTNITKSGKFLWKELCATLEARIKDFKEGERFLTLDEICREYGVSRITACRVSGELEKKGLISKKPKKGSVVLPRRENLEIFFLSNPNPADFIMPYKAQVVRTMASSAESGGRDLKIVSGALLPYALNTPGAAKRGCVCFEGLSETNLACLLKNNIPFVILNPSAPQPAGCSVSVDHFHGGYLAGRHLLERGRRRIAILRNNLSDPYHNLRFNGVLKAMSEFKVPLDMSLVKFTGGGNALEDGETDEETAFDELFFGDARPPDAVFAGNDYRAIKLLDYCARKGVAVPGDVDVVGYDNLEESAMVSPSLSTIDLRMPEICAAAFSLLEAAMSGGAAAGHVTVRPALVVRESSPVS